MADTKKIIQLVVLILAILMWAGAGLMKAVPLGDGIEDIEEAVDVPETTLRIIGVIEVLGAIGLAMPRTRFYAGLGLTLVAVGALASHVAASDWGGVFAPILPGALAIAVWWPLRPAGFPRNWKA